MTNPGYSLANPSLKTKYIKILQAVVNINNCDAEPTRAEVRDITGITHDQGFDKAVNALIDAGWLKESKEGNLNSNTSKFPYDLIVTAAANSIYHYNRTK